MRGLSHGVTAGDGYLKNTNLGHKAARPQGHKERFSETHHARQDKVWPGLSPRVSKEEATTDSATPDWLAHLSVGYLLS